MFFHIPFSGKSIMSGSCWEPSVVPEKPGQEVEARSTSVSQPLSQHSPWQDTTIPGLIGPWLQAILGPALHHGGSPRATEDSLTLSRALATCSGHVLHATGPNGPLLPRIHLGLAMAHSAEKTGALPGDPAPQSSCGLRAEPGHAPQARPAQGCENVCMAHTMGKTHVHWEG